MELERSLNEFRSRGYAIAGLSYDSPAVLKHFSERAKITFPLLSDADSKVIRAFGILNESVPKNTPFYGIPHPGSYLLDREGKVVSKYFEDDFTERDTASSILVKQFGAAAAGASHTTAETKHLRISSSASASIVRSGQHIVLTLDIDLLPKMHVYAPGVQEGYRPIYWKLNDSAGVAATAVQYPASKMLRLPAIDETVPVYDSQFRLVREITIAKDSALKPLLSERGELTIEGEFSYQACDDKVCYIPAKVPLRWTLLVEGHDRQRVPAELQRK